MVQKTIWLLVLATGMLNSFYSCNKNIDVDKSYVEELNYTNNSNHTIELIGYNNQKEYHYSLGIAESLTQRQGMMFSSVKDDLLIILDSIKVSFDNDKTSTFYRNHHVSSFDVLDRNNYTFVKVSDNEKSYTYIFTENDYNHAE